MRKKLILTVGGILFGGVIGCLIEIYTDGLKVDSFLVCLHDVYIWMILGVLLSLGDFWQPYFSNLEFSN